MSLQTIFIKGLPPVTVERPRGWQVSDEGYGYAHSQVLVCPRCLKQWAVLHFAEDAEHHVQGAYCVNCPPDKPEFHSGVIPGSILGNYNIDHPLLSVLPDYMIQREFVCHLNAFERSK